MAKRASAVLTQAHLLDLHIVGHIAAVRHAPLEVPRPRKLQTQAGRRNAHGQLRDPK